MNSFAEKRKLFEERRAAPRYRTSVQVCYRLPGERSKQAITRDISSCGAFIATRASLPVGSPVEVIIQLDYRNSAATLVTKGRVVRADKEGAGISWGEPQVKKSLPAGEYIEGTALFNTHARDSWIDRWWKERMTLETCVDAGTAESAGPAGSGDDS